MANSKIRRAVTVLIAIALLVSFLPATATSAAISTKPTASKVIFFASDGMRPDLMERYASAGCDANLCSTHGKRRAR